MILEPFVDSTTLALDLVDKLMAEELGQGAQSDLPTGKDTLPFAQAFAWGGEQDRLNNWPTIDVSFFASSFAQASSLAAKFEARLLGYPHIVDTSGRAVVVDRVEVVTPAVEVPWLEESTTRRFTGTYSLSARR